MLPEGQSIAETSRAHTQKALHTSVDLVHLAIKHGIVAICGSIL
jgi:hypothetical protein